MKRMILILAGMAMAVPTGLRAAPALTTPNAVTCREWRNTTDKTARAMFLVGAIDVLAGFMAETVENSTQLKIKLSAYAPIDLSATEARDGIDLFCGAPENSIVPVYNAMKIVALRANGGTPAEIETATALIRKIAHALADLKATPAPKQP